jgi:hypothetical protein
LRPSAPIDEWLADSRPPLVGAKVRAYTLERVVLGSERFHGRCGSAEVAPKHQEGD